MMSMISRLWKVGVVLAVVVGVGAAERGECGEDEQIRVGLSYPRTLGSLVVSGEGEWKADGLSEGLEGDARVSVDGRELVVEAGDRRSGVGSWIEFAARDDAEPLSVDGRRYRGVLRVELARGGLQAVNTVGLEDYVRGVVPNEMFAHSEAFKVQAVVARTYALYVKDVEGKHRRDGFDICATGHCQVYGGADTERQLSDEAVWATRGEVLTHRGRPIFAAYHANAGGLTQGVDEAWPGSIRRDFPYLDTVASPYDAAATELPGYEWCYRWERKVRGSDLEERLGARGKRVGEVQALMVRDRTSTGRVRELEVVGKKGRVRLRTPAEVRSVLGTPSANFEVAGGGGWFELSGLGRGHGVGMSQHGALGMAKAGYSYGDILGHFYTGVCLTADCGRGESRELRAPELSLESVEAPAVMVPEGQS